MSVAIFWGLLVLLKLTYCVNLIRNPGMEDGITFPWSGHNAVVKVRSDEAHSGKSCLQVLYRFQNESGLSQHISVKQGYVYKFKAFIKQLDGRHGNLNFKLFQTYNVSIIYTWRDNGKEDLYKVAFRPFIQFGSGWFSLEGEHAAPQRDFSLAQILLHGPEPDIDFLIDDVSLEELFLDQYWASDSNTRIDQIRKSTVHISFTHPPSYIPEDIEIQVDLKRHLFGFGCRVNQEWIVDPAYKEYQDIFYKLFNWATLDGFDWTKNKGTKDNPDYRGAERAMDALLQHGVKLRGNAMFWGLPGNSPDWVEKLDGPSLKTAIQDRVTHITNITWGKISHWNVNNELLHGQLYEERTGDANYSKTIYNLVKEADPAAKLFLNDFDVVTSGAGTEAYIDLANDFLSTHTSLYGLGAESPVEDPPTFVIRVDVNSEHTWLRKKAQERFQDSLANLSRPRLPIWISNLRIHNESDAVRGDYLKTMLSYYFSNPSVEGVTLSGFWDHDTGIHSSLFDGPAFHRNYAGQSYLEMMKRWSTHVRYNLTEGPIHPIRGFQGDYDVTVYYKGKPIMTRSIFLGKNDFMYKVTIDGTEHEQFLTTTVNPLNNTNHNKHIAHVMRTDIGTLTSRVRNSSLQCTNRWSALSEFGVVTETHVNCEEDEVLTGCSSLHEDKDWMRGGEAIEIRSGKLVCSAKTLSTSTVGIYAIARCCKTADITCKYFSASAKTVGQDEEMEADCPLEYLITGCSTRNDQGKITEASPSDNHHGCFAHKPRNAGNTVLYGACCRVQTLTCTTVKSRGSGLNTAENTTVSCNDGYVMTSCNVNSYFGRTAGAFIEEDSDGKDQCVGINGANKAHGETGAVAVAVCCSLDNNRIPLIG